MRGSVRGDGRKPVPYRDVLGLVKQGLGYDFDRLHDTVNQHMTLRQFLGHTDSDKKRYHYPTDVNLLLDAMRCMLRHAGPLGSEHKVPDWCQWMHLLETVTDKFNKIRKTRRARRKDIKVYLKLCTKLIGRVKALLLELAAKGVSPQKINKIEYFAMYAVRQIDQIGRRLLKGETIPQNEKVFSNFEPHTRWISKGKAGRPVELGIPVGIAEDQYQFILHYEIMWTGSDVDFAVPLVEITKELFLDFCAASFDRGFHSPANRARLDKLLVDNALPKKGRLSKADRDREQGETFAAMRRQHPAVESAINNLEHRVRSKGREGFARTVALAVFALKVHRLGHVLRQQAREQHRLAA